jgi:hypothetical protein
MEEKYIPNTANLFTNLSFAASIIIEIPRNISMVSSVPKSEVFIMLYEMSMTRIAKPGMMNFLEEVTFVSSGLLSFVRKYNAIIKKIRAI